MASHRHPASFRDPSGFVFTRHGELYRQVHGSYLPSYELLQSSGLYASLVELGLLIRTTEAPLEWAENASAVRVLKPERIPTISYSFEWCFSQLKDAALLTLAIQEKAIEFGMSLKDASAYNVQFLNGKPIFIDSLSFEPYQEGKPWVAYRQFCRHFVGPLALMALVDIRLNYLQRSNLEGIPLDIASHLLPGSSKFKPGLLAHIHLHAKGNARQSVTGCDSKAPRVSKTGMRALIESLRNTVEGLRWKAAGTEWADYAIEHNYSDAGMVEKKKLAGEFVSDINPAVKTCWDLGANVGQFSEIVAKMGAQTVAWDIDPVAVERAYLNVERLPNVLPLLQDLVNPSPALGWSLTERESIVDRGPVDLVLALALVHHLAISNNVPLSRIASFLARLAHYVIIEFVPKGDPQAKRLLTAREDIFGDYAEPQFEEAMLSEFSILRKEPVSTTGRSLYLLRRNS